ncbi:MAG: endonuclease domain-containing protein [Pseudonocardia sp.]|nr:endonuclease domain-containing protein [Pseudonocardia sp.]
MTVPPHAVLDAHLRRQAGVITRRQALAAGLSPDAVDRRLAARRWKPLHPQVYLDGSHRTTDEVRVRAAVLWAGADAVLSGVAAAWWHGISPALPATVQVTVPRSRCPRPRPGVGVRRREIAAEDLTSRHGVPVTAVPLTVLEAAVELGTDGGPFLDRALQVSTTFPAVLGAYRRNLGRHGSSTMHTLLAAAADGAASAAGRALADLLREARLPGWRPNFPVAGFGVDVAFPEHRVAIEVDGWAWHVDEGRRQRDLWRRTVLVRGGWTVLRFTWHDLVGRPRAVLAEIVHALARGRRALTGA